jgi:hypothetical protein
VSEYLEYCGKLADTFGRALGVNSDIAIGRRKFDFDKLVEAVTTCVSRSIDVTEALQAAKLRVSDPPLYEAALRMRCAVAKLHKGRKSLTAWHSAIQEASTAIEAYDNLIVQRTNT